MSSGVQFPGGIPDFPFDANLRRPRSVVNSTARRTGPDTPALNQQTWFCNRYSGKNTIMNAMGVTAPVRAQAAAMPTAPQAAASPTEKKNAGDNAGEECPGMREQHSNELNGVLALQMLVMCVYFKDIVSSVRH